MATTFGDINNMTMSQFQTAMDYYTKKINDLNADTTIDEHTKNWFLDVYNERLTFLNTTLLHLKDCINVKKVSGFVNEEIATFASLGYVAFDNNSLGRMNQNRTKHNWGQALKIVGSILLPVVGTIPLLLSWRKARRNYQAVQSALTEENIDLENFINNEKRPYEANLGKKEAFTESEMQQLLENPTEISRLQSILTSSSLNPVEKKNLTEKMVALREYAQKHGYPLPTGVLSDPKFKTDKDKLTSKITTLRASINSVSTTVSNLADAQKNVEKLESLRVEVETLLSANASNADLSALLTLIDTNIQTIKTNSKTFIENGATAIANSMAYPTGTTKADYEASNTDIDTIYNNSPTTTFGVDLATAIAIANEFGIPTNKLDLITSKHNAIKSSNDTHLEPFLKEEELTSYISSIAATSGPLETITNDIASGSYTDAIKVSDGLRQLNEMESKLNSFLSFKESLPVGHPLKSQFDTTFLKVKNAKRDLQQLQANFSVDDVKFDAQKLQISTHIPVLTGATPDDKATLQSKKSIIQLTLDEINKPEYDAMFRGTSRVSELTTLRAVAQNYISQIDAKIAEYDRDEEAAEHARNEATKNLSTYASDVTTNSYSPTLKKDDLTIRKAALTRVLADIDNATYKTGLSSKVDMVIHEARTQLDLIEAKLLEIQSFEAELDNAMTTITKLISGNTKSKDAKIAAEAQRIHVLKARAAAYGIEDKVISVTSAAKGYLDSVGVTITFS